MLLICCPKVLVMGGGYVLAMFSESCGDVCWLCSENVFLRFW